MRAYADTEKVSTNILKSLAVVLVALRQQMGDPSGLSHAYKLRAAEMYRNAGIGPTNTSNVSANVRYHINNLLRVVYTAAELEDANLKTASAVERSAERRQLTRAVVQAATASTRAEALPAGDDAASTVRAVSDHLRIAEMLQSSVGRMQPDTIRREMTPAQRGVLYQRLQAVKQEITALSGILRDAGMERPPA